MLGAKLIGWFAEVLSELGDGVAGKSVW